MKPPPSACAKTLVASKNIFNEKHLTYRIRGIKARLTQECTTPWRWTDIWDESNRSAGTLGDVLLGEEGALEHRGRLSRRPRSWAPRAVCSFTQCILVPKGGQEQRQTWKTVLRQVMVPLTAWVPSSVPITCAVARARVRSVQRLPA